MASHSYTVKPATGDVHGTIIYVLDHISPSSEATKTVVRCFSSPLIQELKDLWLAGVRTYDCSMKNNFMMRAVMTWTISEFPAYGMLSRLTTHGRYLVPIVLE